MIDPILSLAFSIQSNRGVYALLLGSGVSRAAEIPTGWEITLDLVRKLARSCGEECEPAPEHWFREKFGQPPDYSQLLAQLAKEPAERQQLLEPYFEADEQEREEGKKRPTAAHHAIAQLAAQGFIRVIITTNFDRLLEFALNEAGVIPTVISSEDETQGTLPLIHTKCCVFKVHGDYRDPRIRNTPKELAEYPDEFNKLLDRIFDEFGLIVCGWSGDWDEALRNAISRAPSRRFTTFWTTRGKPSHHAQRLIDHRQAHVITIEDADTFFQAVQQHVESIEEFSKPHPLSTEAAVASLKRYLPEPRHQIRLGDLIDETVKRVQEETAGQYFNESSPHPAKESVTSRFRAYDAACSTMMAMAIVGGRWAEQEHIRPWQRALQCLYTVPRVGGKEIWLKMRHYPCALLLYALGLGAVEAAQLTFLGKVFSTRVLFETRERLPVIQLLAPYRLINGGRLKNMLEGKEHHFLPLNEWMYETLLQHARREIPDEEQYAFNFVKLEILMSLSALYQPRPIWMAINNGTYMYRSVTSWNVLQEIKQSISSLSDESPFVIADIFGKTAEICMQRIADLEQKISDRAEPDARFTWRTLQERAGY